ncbi:GNAT family N-acetyltransferase [Flavobacterium agricola]|uniref:GNAT family N-acetyltransferase n=1 Tax=Flavobacterium agricola TaxID=2870839 RepID=UPI002223D2F1|nr:GNAT family N-acetyltransferase [Flavobacterium agricola]
MVALQNNEVLGYAYYDSYNPKQGYKYTVEHSIYLKPGNEGKGLGKLLMQALIDAAKKQHIKTMIALIDEENTGSIKFHKKFNFTTVGVMKQVGYKFDTWLDCRIMQLIF